jgi:uncharacterized protein (TIGR03437 family)
LKRYEGDVDFEKAGQAASRGPGGPIHGYVRLLGLLGCAATLAAAPAITGVYNAASWLPTALPNSGVAQGAIFTVTGTGLGPSALQQVQSYPLPTTAGLGGTTVQVTVGAITETCIMIYIVATQVAAILPSATPIGAGTLTLTYEGGRSSIAIQVLAADFGTFTLNEGGTGPGVLTDTSYNPITMVNAAHPGDTLILWGSGLGAVTGNETEPPVQVDLGTGVQVEVEGQPATVLYGGRGSSPGLDQINFIVPTGVSGCKTSVAVIVKGVAGNVTTTSIAPAGQATCGDTYNGLTTANLQKALTSGTLNMGGVVLSRVDNVADVLTATFRSYDLNSLIRSYGGSTGPSVGSCAAYETSGSTLEVVDPVQPTYLNAGPALTITGPNGTRTVTATSTGNYPATLASNAPVYLAPGNYTVANGSGGANVGPFTWGVTLPANVVPNIPASVNRAQDLTITWTGGTGFSAVSIIGYTGVAATASLNSYVEFVCSALASAGQFTIPASILSLLPPGGYGLPGKPGVNIQVAGIPTNPYFTATGSPGIDVGIFSAFITSGGIAAIQ